MATGWRGVLQIYASDRAPADGTVFAVSTCRGGAQMSTARTVVAVSTQPQHAALLHMLVAEVGGYDVIQVASLPTAYSRVREVAPELVVVMLSIDDAEACQLLSMLALDEQTSHIPVVSCTVDPDTGSVDAVLVGNAGGTSADVLVMEMH